MVQTFLKYMKLFFDTIYRVSRFFLSVKLTTSLLAWLTRGLNNYKERMTTTIKESKTERSKE